MAAPNFKHGRYSKYLPERLMEKYAEAAEDSELLAMRDEIALTDARLGEVIERIDKGGEGPVWDQLKASYQELRRAFGSEDPDQLKAALRSLDGLIRRGADDYVAWQEVGRLLEQRRKLVESERKRLVEMKQMISAERAMVLLAAVMDTIKRNVTDRSVLAAISADIGRLMAVQPAEPAEPAEPAG